MTPMIDCVILLLFFFMITANLQRQENEMRIGLPGLVEQVTPLELPDEQTIEILADGSVVLNNQKFDAEADGSPLPELARVLTRFHATAVANKTAALITVAPDGAVRQQRVVDVLNACAAAQISNVTFAVEDDA